MTMPVLQTERLILRPLSVDDAAQMQEKFDNWNKIRLIGGGVPWPYPEDGAARFLEDILPKIQRGDIYSWVITLRKNPQELIGQITYRHKTDKEDHRSFWLAEPFWGNGYMTEAVCAVQDFIFLDLGVDRILVKNAKANVASRRIKEKTGARLIGEGKGTFHDESNIEEIWEITREGWGNFRRTQPIK